MNHNDVGWRVTPDGRGGWRRVDRPRQIVRSGNGSAAGDNSPPADPLEDLIAQCANDPALPFEPAHVKRLVDLRRRDRAGYERALARLKAARVRASELDKSIARAAGDGAAADRLPGRALTWAEDEAWPDPVDGAALLDAIETALRRFVVVTDDQVHAIALWAVAAHALDCFDAFPRLAIWSPVKRCGKSRLLGLLRHVAPRALTTSNISPAATFRAVDKAQPTLIVDEAETFTGGDHEELRGILNSGHQRDLAFVVRTVGEDHEPRQFSTWCAMSVALIGKLWPTLADRSIEIAMRRRGRMDRLERFRSTRADDLARLRRMAARWVADHAAQLARWDGHVPEGLHDRAADNWLPLFAVAECAGGEWPARARAAAIALTGVEEDDEVAILLLADVRTIFAANKGAGRLSTAAILTGLHGMAEDRKSVV